MIYCSSPARIFGACSEHLGQIIQNTRSKVYVVYPVVVLRVTECEVSLEEVMGG